MERYKLPAGRLATIFYKANPNNFPAKNISGSDSEIGVISDEDIPPTAGDLLEKPTSYRVTAHNGRTLAWKNVTLEIVTKDGRRRLLDNLSGWSDFNICHVKFQYADSFSL